VVASNTPGDWYLTVRCECGDWIVIGRSDGPASHANQPPERLSLTCDACGETANYAPDSWRHSRVASLGPTRTAG
jgi:hypothetical protein